MATTMTIILTGTLLILPFIFTFILWKNRNNLEDEEFIENFGALNEGIRKD